MDKKMKSANPKRGNYTRVSTRLIRKYVNLTQ